MSTRVDVIYTLQQDFTIVVVGRAGGPGGSKAECPARAKHDIQTG